jgi:uncharacterized Zn-binding protein involved in type VI secretion
MPLSVARNGDSCTGDSPYIPTTSNGPVHDLLYIDGSLANTVDHAWPNHTCNSHTPQHSHFSRKTSTGSPLVTVEGKALARVGDSISSRGNGHGTCSAKLAQGSETVFSD